jgi:hypothetical protein
VDLLLSPLPRSFEVCLEAGADVVAVDADQNGDEYGNHAIAGIDENANIHDLSGSLHDAWLNSIAAASDR